MDHDQASAAPVSAHCSISDLRAVPLTLLAEPDERLADVVVHRVLAGSGNPTHVPIMTFQSAI